MNRAPQAAMLLIVCVLTSGCAATLHGHQSAGAGGSSTMVSGAVHGSAQSSNIRTSVAFGSAVAPDAPGGHLRVTGHAVGWLVAGALIAGLIDQTSRAGPHALPENRPIAHTCSCFGYNPTGSETAQAGGGR